MFAVPSTELLDTRLVSHQVLCLIYYRQDMLCENRDKKGAQLWKEFLHLWSIRRPLWFCPRCKVKLGIMLAYCNGTISYFVTSPITCRKPWDILVTVELWKQSLVCGGWNKLTFILDNSVNSLQTTSNPRVQLVCRHDSFDYESSPKMYLTSCFCVTSSNSTAYLYYCYVSEVTVRNNLDIPSILLQGRGTGYNSCLIKYFCIFCEQFTLDHFC